MHRREDRDLLTAEACHRHSSAFAVRKQTAGYSNVASAVSSSIAAENARKNNWKREHKQHLLELRCLLMSCETT